MDGPPVEIAVPALLRSAWRAYADAVRARLEEAGIGDLPRHGSFVLGGMANHGLSASDMVDALGVTKQRASQLIDTLVLRGYLARQPHPEDRRRSTLQLTERGRAAADEIHAALAGLDARLAATLSAREIAIMRRGLAALAGMRGAP